MEKLNIAELLKNCPTGMELDCTMYNDVHFDYISDCGSFIYCYINHEDHKTSVSFNRYGAYSNLDKAKCVIFPKGKTTWEGFTPPCQFKDGDIIYNRFIQAVAIFCKQTDKATISHCFLNSFKELRICHYHCKLLSDWRLATEEEKEKLFKAIKDNGYKWNSETKTLEKLPKFKVGDKIRHKKNTTIIKTIGHIYSDGYALYDGHLLYFKEQDEWELVPNKFDINTLKPFDKVLVRNTNNGKWCGQFYMDYNKNEDYPFECTYNCWRYCIPYEGNEYLRGTTDNCSNYYKIWKE